MTRKQYLFYEGKSMLMFIDESFRSLTAAWKGILVDLFSCPLIMIPIETEEEVSGKQGKEGYFCAYL